VLDRQGSPRDAVTSLYAGARAKLTPLRIPPEPAGFALASFALSPSGTSLAVASNYGELQVFNLVTGARRTWQATPNDSFPYDVAGAANAMLAWQGQHTLAFVWDGLPFSADGVRLLDTQAPGPDLLADSRLVQPKSVIGHDAYWRQILPTAGGRTLITVLEVPGTKAFPHLGQEVTEFALHTGRVRIVNHISAAGLQGDYETVLWASPAGRVLIVSGTRHVRHPPAAQPFFIGGARVLTPGHSRPIPWSNATFAAAW
jgi:hypothetical protein